MNKRIATIAIAAGLAMTISAQATWRVVGPGMAVGEARTGTAALAAECLHDGLVLGVYNIGWRHDSGEELDLVVDGQSFALHQYASGDRIVFSDADTGSGGLDVSSSLRAALKTGREARLEGPAVGHIERREITFGLLRSEQAITTVERFCGE